MLTSLNVLLWWSIWPRRAFNFHSQLNNTIADRGSIVSAEITIIIGPVMMLNIVTFWQRRSRFPEESYSIPLFYFLKFSNCDMYVIQIGFPD